ncbi:hypothetical protein J421_4035 [Gemmatirosa kalamazoonensis]|uniref:Uncharacterized protein n=1 Tax=Gemmatirosa kalamazoonensis TaxID=861299 RepID=W0RM82_9BACT|nr:hypothetical protein [Gemmatirosa kalamazoonensis]AHG91572.1 hypothetical protein J421_4035 [Gemmatirosa kalamazoonensis]
MSTKRETRREPAAYTSAVPREVLLAEAISCILNGRPYPAGLRAPSFQPPRPMSVTEGIRWILGNPRAVRTPS